MMRLQSAIRLVGILTLPLALLVACGFADSTETKERTVSKLAEGVYEIRHPDAPDGFPQGNTTVVIGKRDVLVVDSCLLPSSARQDIEQIHKWTNLPVTYLVNTHWHFDHTMGNATYAEAFPAIQIVASRMTQQIIADFNPGALARYPSRAERFKKVLDSGKGPDGRPLSDADRKDYEHSIAGLVPVVEEFKSAHQLVPNVAFDHELDVDLGDRPVQIKFLGRGNTAGDTVIFLPHDKIIATGDLLDHPVPYAFGGFPVDLVNTLHGLAALDATTIVPGHGDVMHDKKYIEQVIAWLTAVNAEVEKAVNDGKTLEETQDQVPKAMESQGWKQKFAGESSDDAEFFDQSFSGLVKASYNQIHTR